MHELDARARTYFSKGGAVWWEGSHQFHVQQIEDIVRFVDPKDKIILDAGVGKGRLAIALAKAGARKIVGVDISRKMLQIAKRRAKADGVLERILLHQGDIEELRYKNETFDLVYCLETFVHLPNPQKAMNEFARVCKRGGSVIADADYRYGFKVDKLSTLNKIKNQVYYSKPFYPFRLVGFKLFDRPLVPLPSVPIYRTIAQEEFINLFENSGLHIHRVSNYGSKSIFSFIIVFAEKKSD